MRNLEHCATGELHTQRPRLDTIECNIPSVSAKDYVRLSGQNPPKLARKFCSFNQEACMIRQCAYFLVTGCGVPDTITDAVGVQPTECYSDSELNPRTARPYLLEGE